jgi:hypothetical protein
MLTRVLDSAPDAMALAPGMRARAEAIADYVAKDAARRTAIDTVIKQKALPGLVKFIRSDAGDKRGGWIATTGKPTGFGEDYWFRTAAKFAGIWWNNNQEVVYFIGEADASVDGPADGVEAVGAQSEPELDASASTGELETAVVQVDLAAGDIGEVLRIHREGALEGARLHRRVLDRIERALREEAPEHPSTRRALAAITTARAAIGAPRPTAHSRLAHGSRARASAERAQPVPLATYIAQDVASGLGARPSQASRRIVRSACRGRSAR